MGGQTYELRASPGNVHWGYFSAAVGPSLSVRSGDVVVIEDVPRVDPEVIEASGVVPGGEIPDHHRTIYREVTDRGPGPHIMVGPVHVEGAAPGDVLEIQILEVELAFGYGYNVQRPYAGTLPDDFTRFWRRVFRLDRERRVAEVARGVLVPLDRPFFGTMGVAPPAALGRISTFAPGVHGGNMDCKDLGAGATLYLPVHVEGARFSAGDGHAAQGHGEVDVNAIETGLRGRFRLVVRKGMSLRWPRGETPTHWIVMGLHEDLDEAMRLAVRETLDFLVERFPHLSRQEAYMIASVAVDYHVTQSVAGTKGIHGMIPKALFVDR